MNTAVDLSVLVTFHNETLVAGPTMKAADAAIECARAAGLTVEPVMVLDNATEKTAAWCRQSRFDHWDRWDMAEGDLGRVRNAAVPRTKGRYVAFLDADDLFSQNWLRDGVRSLDASAKAGCRAIAHPELNWLFDGAHSVFYKPSQDDPLFTPYHFYFMNYYDSLCITPRDCHLDHPYVSRDIPNGLSFQDWQFSIETMAAGWKHINVPDTIIFKRRRDESLVTESRNRQSIIRSLPAMRIDQIEGLGRAFPPRDYTPAEVDLMSKDVPQDAHFGPIVASRAAQEITRPRASKIAKRQAEFFDFPYYVFANQDLLRKPTFDPVQHYSGSMRRGSAAKLAGMLRRFKARNLAESFEKAARLEHNPTPWFDSAAYVQKYPDVKGQNPFDHWVKVGRIKGYMPEPFAGFSALAEVLGMSPETAFALWHEKFRDLRDRLATGKLGEMVVAASEIEPLIGAGWQEAMALRIPPFQNSVVARRTAAIWRLLQAAKGKRAPFVICVNRARFGGNPRIEGHIARSLAAMHRPEDVLVVVTDAASDMPRGKFPEGVRVVDLPRLAVGNLGHRGRQRLLAEFLRAVDAKAVFNVNSRLMWEMMQPYGAALGTSMDLYGVLLCNERTVTGAETGYPLRRVYRHYDQLAGIITDSQYLKDDLEDRFAIAPGKIVPLPNPVDMSIPAVVADASARDVFWAGRFDAQKRVDLVYRVAAAMPDVTFRLWGQQVMGGAGPLPDKPRNVVLEGTYSSFKDLPLNEAGAWLYTSGWDGVPSVLLEVAMSAVPLVGTLVGGTGEVLRAGLTEPVPLDADAEAYVAALRKALDDPGARDRALQLRGDLIAERSAEAHQVILSAALS